jgi:hypothetical protein
MKDDSRKRPYPYKEPDTGGLKWGPKKLLIPLILTLFLIGGDSGCLSTPETLQDKSEAFTRSAYSTLHTSQTAYNTLTDSLIQLREEGLLNDEAWQKAIEYGDIFADAHNAAVDALYQYKLVASQEMENEVRRQLLAVSKALGKFVSHAQPYIDQFFKRGGESK